MLLRLANDYSWFSQHDSINVTGPRTCCKCDLVHYLLQVRKLFGVINERMKDLDVLLKHLRFSVKSNY